VLITRSLLSIISCLCLCFQTLIHTSYLPYLILPGLAGAICVQQPPADHALFCLITYSRLLQKLTPHAMYFFFPCQGSQALFVRSSRPHADAGWVGARNTGVVTTNKQWRNVIVTFDAANNNYDIFVAPTAGMVNGQSSSTIDMNKFNEHTHVNGGLSDKSSDRGKAEETFTVGKSLVTSGLNDIGQLQADFDDIAVFDNCLSGPALQQLITQVGVVTLSRFCQPLGFNHALSLLFTCLAFQSPLLSIITSLAFQSRSRFCQPLLALPLLSNTHSSTLTRHSFVPYLTTHTQGPISFLTCAEGNTAACPTLPVCASNDCPNAGWSSVQSKVGVQCSTDPCPRNTNLCCTRLPVCASNDCPNPGWSSVQSKVGIQCTTDPCPRNTNLCCTQHAMCAAPYCQGKYVPKTPAGRCAALTCQSNTAECCQSTVSRSNGSAVHVMKCKLCVHVESTRQSL